MEILPEPDGLVTLPPLAAPDALEVFTDGAITADDPRAATLLAAASAAIRGRAGWHIAPVIRETVTVTDTYGGGGLDVLVPSGRVRDVTAVRVDGRNIPRYAWSPDGGVWAGWLSTGQHRIEVDLEHGYHFSEVQDLAAVAVQVAAVALSSPQGAIREQAGQVSVTWGQTSLGVAGGLTLLDRDLAAVDAYRLGGAP